MFLADAESYGADKLWCLLKPIPIELDDEEAEPEIQGNCSIYNPAAVFFLVSLAQHWWVR